MQLQNFICKTANKQHILKIAVRREPITIATIVLVAAATTVLLLLLSSLPSLNYQPAYSQMTTTTNLGSQNLSSLLKNLLRLFLETNK